MAKTSVSGKNWKRRALAVMLALAMTAQQGGITIGAEETLNTEVTSTQTESAEEKARKEAEAAAAAAAEEQARLEAEAAAAEKARLEAEAAEKARLEAEAAEQARLESEAKAKAEAEAAEKARQESEAKAKEEAEAKAKAESEAKAKEEAEAKARAESEAKAKEEAEAKAKAESEAKAREESEAKAKAESEARAKEESEAKAKAESEAKAKEESEAKAKAESEAKAKAESEAKAKAESEAKAKAESEAKAREESEKAAGNGTEQKTEAAAQSESNAPEAGNAAGNGTETPNETAPKAEDAPKSKMRTMRTKKADEVKLAASPLSFHGTDYDATLSFGSDVKIPEGTTLEITEGFDAGAYRELAEKEMKLLELTEISESRFFKIVLTVPKAKQGEKEQTIEAGNVELHIDFHKNTTSHAEDEIYAGLFDAASSNISLFQKNSDQSEVIGQSPDHVITSLTLKKIDLTNNAPVVAIICGKAPAQEEESDDSNVTGGTEALTEEGESDQEVESGTEETVNESDQQESGQEELERKESDEEESDQEELEQKESDKEELDQNESDKEVSDQEESSDAAEDETEAESLSAAAPSDETEAEYLEGTPYSDETETEYPDGVPYSDETESEYPDGIPYSDETETEYPYETETEFSDETEPETENVEETETEATKRDYYFDDGRIYVHAELEEASQVPDDAKLVVTELTPASSGYNYDAYMGALNDATAKEYDESSTLLYDIAFIGPERDENGEETGNKIEYQPAEGTVHIEVTMKRSQLSEMAAEQAPEAQTPEAQTSDVKVEQTVEVLHLPLNESVKEATETTADATNISASDINVEQVSADVNLAGGTDNLNFSASSFSVFAFKVDFYYGDLEYHVDGGGTYPLTEILKNLNITRGDGQTVSNGDIVIEPMSLLSC